MAGFFSDLFSGDGIGGSNQGGMGGAWDKLKSGSSFGDTGNAFSGTGATSIGGVGASAYLAPASQGGVAATPHVVNGTNALSFGGAAMSYTPSASLQAGTQAQASSIANTPTTGLGSSLTASGAPEVGTGFGHTTAEATTPNDPTWKDKLKAGWDKQSDQQKGQFVSNMITGLGSALQPQQEQQAQAPAPRVGSGKMDMSAFKNKALEGIPQMYQMPAYNNVMGG